MNSPFVHLFNRNQPPSATDIPVINDLISAPLEKLDRLDSEIARLETVIANRKQERDDVQKYVDAHKRLLSPSLRLPPEILSEIFIRCLPEGRNPICSLSDAPLLLGLVCRSWRDVSLSTPHLWSSIHVAFSKSIYVAPTMGAKRHGVKAWLDRSGSLPLSFSIFGNSHFRHDIGAADPEQKQETEMFYDHLKQLFQYFIQQTHRWQNVELRLNRAFANVLGEAITDSGNLDWQMSLLDSLTFHLLAISTEDINSSWVSKLLAAPHLRHLSIGSNIPHVLKHLEQPNPNLQQLTVHWHGTVTGSLQSHDVLPLLSRHAHLRVCCLDIFVPDDSQPVAFDSNLITSLPFLRKLSLNFTVGYNSRIDHALFSMMSVPALRSLTVTAMHVASTTLESAPFIPLLSGNQLRELKLRLRLSLQGYLECLARVPHLIQLTVQDRMREASAKTFIERLTPSMEQLEPLCPKLRQLNLHGFQVDDDLMLDLARRRRVSTVEGVASLEEFHARFSRSKQLPDIEQQVDELRQQGMEVTFQHYPEEKDDPSAGQQTTEDPFSFYDHVPLRIYH